MKGDHPTKRIRHGLALGLLLLFLLPIAAMKAVGRVEEDESRSTAAPMEDTRISYHLEGGLNEAKPLRIAFDRAPRFIQALEMAPRRREPKLDRGTWLVLTFLGTSVPDLLSIDVAVQVVSRHQGTINLGVRPFGRYEEIRAWFPEYGETFRSPVWIVYQGGKLQGWEAGPMTEEEVEAFLARMRR